MKHTMSEDEFLNAYQLLMAVWDCKDTDTSEVQAQFDINFERVMRYRKENPEIHTDLFSLYETLKQRQLTPDKQNES
jgi:hypothetical protein